MVPPPVPVTIFAAHATAPWDDDDGHFKSLLKTDLLSRIAKRSVLNATPDTQTLIPFNHHCLDQAGVDLRLELGARWCGSRAAAGAAGEGE
jgi:hypothetical protein